MIRWILVVVLVIALGGLIGWRLHLNAQVAAKQTQERSARSKMAPVVAVAPAAVRDIVHTFEEVGSVESPFNVKIAAKVTGRIDYLQVREGDAVQAGQVLVRVDPSEIAAQVAQSQAALAESRSRLAQAELTQNPTNVSVTTSIRQQQAAMESARADLHQVTENYNSQVAAAQSAVTDAQGKVDSAEAGVGSAKAQVTSAKANLANAQSKFNRMSDLYKQGFIAAQDVDDARTTADVMSGSVDVANGQQNAAQAQLRSAEAQLDSARKNLDIVRTKGKADIEASRARLTQAQAALDYAKSNTAQKPAYQANLAALRSAVAASEASLRNLQAQQANTVLAAPITGYVTARYMDPGSMATSGSPILAIQAFRVAWVNVPVPEEESEKVHVGQTATVRLDAIPGREFTGKIVNLNPSADTLSRQFTARVELDNRQNLIKPGMFARVDVVTDRITGALVVPREAVQQGKDGATVTVVDEANTSHKEPVTVGASDANGIAVLSGLEAGQKVVVMSGMPLRDGQPVRLAGAKPGRRSGGYNAAGAGR